MDIFSLAQIRAIRITKWQIVGLIVAILILSYFGLKSWRPDIFQKLTAGMFKLITREEMVEEEPVEEELFAQAPEILFEGEEEKYLERAEKGEGITHLARKTLKKYLQDNPQDFEVTPEHKIYIEDYLAKKMGNGWLNLGQELEFDQDLIEEAVEKAGELTPEQLANLTQFSQLVPQL